MGIAPSDERTNLPYSDRERTASTVTPFNGEQQRVKGIQERRGVTTAFEHRISQIADSRGGLKRLRHYVRTELRGMD